MGHRIITLLAHEHATVKAFSDNEENLIVILWNETPTLARTLTLRSSRVRSNWFYNSGNSFLFIPFYKIGPKESI